MQGWSQQILSDDASYFFIQYTIIRIQYYVSALQHPAIAYRHNNVAILISRQATKLNIYYTFVWNPYTLIE